MAIFPPQQWPRTAHAENPFSLPLPAGASLLASWTRAGTLGRWRGGGQRFVRKSLNFVCFSSVSGGYQVMQAWDSSKKSGMKIR